MIEAERTESFSLRASVGGGNVNTVLRVMLYVNGKPMPVFDGKYYADAPLENGKQTDIDMVIDTTELGEYNNIMLTYYNIEDKADGTMRLLTTDMGSILKVNG